MTKIKKEATIDAPVTTVYAAWRNFENFPDFMKNIEEVTSTSDTMSHWKATGPLGMDAEWDAEITLDEPNKAIGWRGIEGASSVINSGRVNFKEAGADRTHLDVTIEYAAPGGIVGDLAAKIFANPEHQVEEDLERFRACVAGGIAPGTARFSAAPSQGETSLGTGIEDGLEASYTEGTSDARIAVKVGAVMESDPPDPRSDPMAQADARQAGL